MKIYQYENISVAIGDGTVQSLVQSVTVNAELGLDFVNIPTTGSQAALKKGQIITIEINYLSDGSFLDPTKQPLCNSKGDITLQVMESPLEPLAPSPPATTAKDILFKDCVLIGTSSSVDASSSFFGSSSLTYQSMYYTQSSSTSARPTPPSGDVTGTRVCYAELETNQVSYSSNCQITRNLLYEPGKVAPTHYCIQYPIVTTSTVGLIQTAGSLKGAGQPGDCDATATAGSLAGIEGAFLEGVDIEGGEAGSSSYQVVSYNYKSTETYDLTRLISVE